MVSQTEDLPVTEFEPRGSGRDRTLLKSIQAGCAALKTYSDLIPVEKTCRRIHLKRSNTSQRRAPLAVVRLAGPGGPAESFSLNLRSSSPAGTLL